MPNLTLQERLKISWKNLGRWCDLHTQDDLVRPRSYSSDQPALLMGENPALAWNNYNPSKDRLHGAALPMLQPLIERFDLRLIFAPAVVYSGEWLLNKPLSADQSERLGRQTKTKIEEVLKKKSKIPTKETQRRSSETNILSNSEKNKNSSKLQQKQQYLEDYRLGDKHQQKIHGAFPQTPLAQPSPVRRLLVAGHALELNAISPVKISLSIPQLTLITSIVHEISELLQVLAPKLSSSCSVANATDVPDSGVDCDASSADVRMSVVEASNSTTALGSAVCGKPHFASIEETTSVQESSVVDSIQDTDKKCAPHFKILSPGTSKHTTSSMEPSSISSLCQSFSARLAAYEDGLCAPEAYELIPVDILFTGSYISCCIYDKKVDEPCATNLKISKKTHRSKLDKRLRRATYDAKEALSTESEASPVHIPIVAATAETTTTVETRTYFAQHQPKPVCPMPLNTKPGSHTVSSIGSLSVVNTSASAASSEVSIGKPEDGYEGSEEGSVCGRVEHPPSKVAVPLKAAGDHQKPRHRVLPLLYALVSQPHAAFSYAAKSHRLEVSCFDLVLKGGPVAHRGRGSLSEVATAADHPTYLVETRPGTPHPRTGVPPALCTVSCQDFLIKPAKVKVDIGKPVRVILSDAKLEEMARVLNILKEKFSCLYLASSPTISLPAQTSTATEETSSAEVLRNSMRFFETIALKTSEIVAEICLKGTESSDGPSSKMKGSIQGVQVTVVAVRKRNSVSGRDIAASKSPGDRISEINMSSSIQDLELHTQYHGFNCIPFMKPWTMTSNIKFSWMPWSSDPYMETFLHSETPLLIDVGPEHLFCLSDALQYFVSKFPKSEQTKKSVTAAKATCPVPCGDGSMDVVYQDDLRAGVFQYFKNASKKEPKPYQILFDNGSGTMTWCYPEPRALTRVDIYPVPFVAASDVTTATTDSSSSNDKVYCALQYFDSLRGEFLTYREFELSECELCHLELPSLYEKHHIAVSSIWRIFLDYWEDDRPGSGPAGRVLVPATALAACIRVDSVFSIPLLPQRQFYLALHTLEINLQNQLSLAGLKLPSELLNFDLLEELPTEHEFLTIHLEASKVHIQAWISSVCCSVRSYMRVSVLDYGFLIKYSLMDPTSVHLKTISHESLNDDKPSCVDVQILCKPLLLRLSQSMLLTLSLAHRLWTTTFSVTQDIHKAGDPGENSGVWVRLGWTADSRRDLG
ncbi:hypothetical protein FHG87_010755 [Trinorchestia longiramus]|nr:hypothetical protein FHG87_010755 [Trinorchestia longiramus]